MKKKNKMTLLIVFGIATGLILWFVCFDTPKYLLYYACTRMNENSFHTAHKTERKKLDRQTAKISIKWTNNPEGDFSFANRWQYDEQTVGYIVEEIEKLMVTSPGDEEIYCKKWSEKEDSLQNCSKTRFPYTLQIDGDKALHHILAEQIDNNTVECQSDGIPLNYDGDGREYDHAVLNLNIVKNECFPLIAFTEYRKTRDFLYSIGYNGYRAHTLIQNVPPFTAVYPCTDGSIAIDRACLEGGWLKASFRFDFKTHYSKKISMSGRIFTPVKYRDVKKPLMEFDEKQYIYDLDLRAKYK